MNAIFRRTDWQFAAVFVIAAALAVCAKPYAASWNDGSRLATIEALVDYHTLAIDNTVYVWPGSANAPTAHHPYLIKADGSDGHMRETGTLDKVFVNGHYYSHQPALPALLLAGPYWLAQKVFGLRAQERPDLFAYFMTLVGSGLPYLVAVAAVGRMSRRLGVSSQLTLLLMASFAFATVAAAYTRQLNVNIMLLAVACLVFLLLVELPRHAVTPPVGKLLLLGLLNGIGYAIEQPTGGLLLAGTGLVLLFRWPSFSTALLYGLAALPSIGIHQAVNYWIAGTWRPLGQVAEYFNYEGSNFNVKNLTGFWNHDGSEAFVFYAARLLYSERGFLPVNVPLWLLAPGSVVLWRRIRNERPEMWLAVLWCVGVWLVYAALSNNYSGSSCGVRWFVPFLAAGYYLLALLMRERPALAPDLLILSLCGAILGAEMWWEGPWAYVFYTFWPVQGLAALSWATYRLGRFYLQRQPDSQPESQRAIA